MHEEKIKMGSEKFDPRDWKNIVGTLYKTLGFFG
jgi:hypothetical protein